MNINVWNLSLYTHLSQEVKQQWDALILWKIQTAVETVGSAPKNSEDKLT